jgi:predicted nucleotidyltransferase
VREQVLPLFNLGLATGRARYAGGAATEIPLLRWEVRAAGTRDSDIDVLVEFDRFRPTRSTLRSVDMALELERLLSRNVDVATENSLHWFIWPQVVAEAVPL